jgi:hypothetical protein
LMVSATLGLSVMSVASLWWRNLWWGNNQIFINTRCL